MEFREKLKDARIAAALTQKEMADKLGIYQKDISRWENGERTPGIDALRGICLTLNTSADRLLGIENIEGEMKVNRIEELKKELSNKLGLLGYYKGAKSFENSKRLVFAPDKSSMLNKNIFMKAQENLFADAGLDFEVEIPDEKDWEAYVESFQPSEINHLLIAKVDDKWYLADTKSERTYTYDHEPDYKTYELTKLFENLCLDLTTGRIKEDQVNEELTGYEELFSLITK